MPSATENGESSCVPDISQCMSSRAAELKHVTLDVDSSPVQALEAAMKKQIRYLTGAVVALGLICLILFVLLLGIGHKTMKNHQDIEDLQSEETTSSSTGGDAVILTTGSEVYNGYSAQGSVFEGSGFWATKNKLPDGGRSDFQAVSDGGEHIYLIGGLDHAGTVVDTVSVYDTLLGTYNTTLEKLPSPRYRFGAAYLSGEIFVIGGFDSNENSDAGKPLATAVAFNVASRTWRTIANTSVPHGDTCAAAIGGKVYVVAGYGIDYETLTTVEVYDPSTDSWTAAASLPEPRGDISCTAVDDTLFAVGGYYDPSGSWQADSFHNTLYSYVPGASEWTRKQDMPTARGDKAVTALSTGRLLVVGGETHARGEVTQIPVHAVEMYHVEHDQWEAKAQIPTARFRFGMTSSGDDLVYAFGGHQLCTTGWFGDWDDPDCMEKALDSLEVYFDQKHPSVYLHTKA